MSVETALFDSDIQALAVGAIRRDAILKSVPLILRTQIHAERNIVGLQIRPI